MVDTIFVNTVIVAQLKANFTLPLNVKKYDNLRDNSSNI